MFIKFYKKTRGGRETVHAETIHLAQKLTQKNIKSMAAEIAELMEFYDQFHSKTLVNATLEEAKGENLHKETSVNIQYEGKDLIEGLGGLLEKEFTPIIPTTPTDRMLIKNLVGWEFKNAFADSKERLIATFVSKTGKHKQYQISRKRDFNNISIKNHKHYDFTDENGERYQVDHRVSNYYNGNTWDISQIIKGETTSILQTKEKFMIQTNKGWIEWGTNRDGCIVLKDITEDEIIISDFETKRESYSIKGVSHEKARDRMFMEVHKKNRCFSMNPYTNTNYLRDHKDFSCTYEVCDDRTGKRLFDMFALGNHDYNDLREAEDKHIEELKEIIKICNEREDFTKLKSFIYPTTKEFVKEMSKHLGVTPKETPSLP